MPFVRSAKEIINNISLLRASNALCGQTLWYDVVTHSAFYTLTDPALPMTARLYARIMKSLGAIAWVIRR